MEEGFSRKEQLAGGFLLVLIVFTVVILLVIAQAKGWFQTQNTYLIKFRRATTCTRAPWSRCSMRRSARSPC